jgi:hypothetical protein
MSEVYSCPKHAPADYYLMAPCENYRGKSSDPIPFPEFTGSGIPLKDHPMNIYNESSLWIINSKCAACGSDNTLCIYYHLVSGLGTGKDMTIELVCKDCGKFTVDYYVD